MPEQQQEILITIIVASVFLVLIGVFLLILVFLFLRRQRKNQQEKEELKNLFEQTLLKTQIEIQDQTLSYIAYEIHDNVGQILSLAKISNIQLTKENFESRTDLIDELLGKAVSDLRGISHNLKNNRFHQIGLHESIVQLLHTIERTGKYTTSFKSPHAEDFEGFIAGKDIIIFRMIQEIINNIINHASAKNIDIVIENDDKIISITIIDDGVGFDTSTIRQERQGIGLENIYSRAKMINTDVEIKSSLGVGTTVILKLKI
ncbi:MAG: ATP-binding protein [Sphingobacteriia bacterium]|jgi:signal transduction histidine kinase